MADVGLDGLERGADTCSRGVGGRGDGRRSWRKDVRRWGLCRKSIHTFLINLEDAEPLWVEPEYDPLTHRLLYCDHTKAYKNHQKPLLNLGPCPPFLGSIEFLILILLVSFARCVSPPSFEGELLRSSWPTYPISCHLLPNRTVRHQIAPTELRPSHSQGSGLDLPALRSEQIFTVSIRPMPRTGLAPCRARASATWPGGSGTWGTRRCRGHPRTQVPVGTPRRTHRNADQSGFLPGIPPLEMSFQNGSRVWSSKDSNVPCLKSWLSSLHEVFVVEFESLQRLGCGIILQAEVVG